ncbi:hypothetical protein F5X99DRAFT_424615 [Biscogniauxia marginata]|nr:hypothetical protein F5X99DRAFT_424615 [Biscogniauxia marginata]
MDNLQLVARQAEDARVARYRDLLTECLLRMPIFDLAGVRPPPVGSYRGWMGVIASLTWADEHPFFFHLSKGLALLVQCAIKTYINYPTVEPYDSDWFWILVYQEVSQVKFIHSGGNYLHVKEVVTFIINGFKNGMRRANMLWPDRMVQVDLYDAILQWIWFTEGANYIIGIQGALVDLPAKFQRGNRDVAIHTVPYSVNGRANQAMRPNHVVHIVPANQANQEGQVNDIRDGRKRRGQEHEGQAEEGSVELEALRDELARVKAEKEAITRERDEARAQRDALQAKLDQETESEPEEADTQADKKDGKYKPKQKSDYGSAD